MRTLALLLLAGLALSGCSDDEIPEASGLGTESADARPGGMDDVPALSRANLTAQATPFAYDGITSAGGCVRVMGVTGTCFHDGSSTACTPLAANGQPERVEGNVTWTPATPHSETLMAMVIIDGSWDPALPGIAGASPLAFAFELSEHTEAELGLCIMSDQVVEAGLAYVTTATTQEFHVEGVYTTLVDADAAADAQAETDA